jgi:hypothetical protein
MRLLGALVAAGLVAAAAAVAAEAPRVTIQVRQHIDPGTRTRELDVTGTVSSGAAGEVVEILAKDCGPNHRFYRVVGGARTLPGGSWRLVTERGGVDLSQIPINAYYRARWKGAQSDPVLVRIPAFVAVVWRPRRRVVDVSVSTGLSGQTLRRRFVELQRKVSGTDQWVLVRRARLAASRDAESVFTARFAVPTRGLTLRAFVPASTGAPCFSAAASNSWTS